jgi:hypothetical protein
MDPNKNSFVLFKRYGCSPQTQNWSLGRVVDTFFVDSVGRVVEPTEENAHLLTPWATIDPEKPEGRSAPSTITVPMDEHHFDPIVHWTELPGEEE